MYKKAFAIMIVAIFLITSLGIISAANDSISIPVKIVWNDVDDTPNEVVVQLIKDNKVVDKVILNDSNSWHAIFKVDSPGNYHVKEIISNDYSSSVSGNVKSGFVIKNSQIVEDDILAGLDDMDFDSDESTVDGDAIDSDDSTVDDGVIDSDDSSVDDGVIDSDESSVVSNGTDDKNSTDNSNSTDDSNSTNNSTVPDDSDDSKGNDDSDDSSNDDSNNKKPTTKTKTTTTTKIIKQNNTPNNTTKHNTGFPIVVLVIAVFVAAFIPLSRRKK